MINLPTVISAAVITDIIRGPMVWAAFVICGTGVIIQFWRLMHLTRKQGVMRLAKNRSRSSQIGETAMDRLVFVRVSILGANPWVVVISFIFHIFLLLTPIVVYAHNVLLDTAFGFDFVSLPEKMTDSMTLIVMVCGCFFFLRRIIVPQVRGITTFSDFVFLFIAISPYVTGFLAYNEMLMNYRLMITLHILCAEIMLIMIPFSKFSHMFFFIISRLIIIGENGRKSAIRGLRYDGRTRAE